jgi:hypothetical protein
MVKAHNTRGLKVVSGTGGGNCKRWDELVHWRVASESGGCP